ncbi:hypothetical protein L207DRAFT_186975 [Hyaloscypha variabilis F]|uniref:Uncharacterized protein n=1 Tax=Hyaloscypha variabilis (strain UAMH 11265 / GT02V1 / F) TaxID=1149755 RepID=A0A2J6QZZ8_HYAVF|nr:hypothetical protein L207DRAFT_186975 [Hyaloscypha variabilis F]
MCGLLPPGSQPRRFLFPVSDERQPDASPIERHIVGIISDSLLPFPPSGWLLRLSRWHWQCVLKCCTSDTPACFPEPGGRVVEIEIEIGFAFCIESIHVVPKEIGRRSHARAWVQHGQRGGLETFDDRPQQPCSGMAGWRISRDRWKSLGRSSARGEECL